MKTNIRFTGKESDQFVQFSLLYLTKGIQPDVLVIGREPITSTNIEISGKVIDTTWDGYKRTVTVLTNDETEYLIGGSNSTKPIASSEIIFQVDLELINCSYLMNDAFDDCIKNINNNKVDNNYLQSINIAIRIDSFKKSQHAILANALIKLLSIANKNIKKQIVSTLGLIENEIVLKKLAELLNDKDLDVRKEASLRLRGQDIVINEIGEDSPIGKYVIDTLTKKLNDIKEDSEVRIYSAENLGYYYNEDGIQALFNSLNDSHEHIKWAISVALGRTNSIAVPNKLIESLKQEEYPTVQQGILLSLGRLGNTIKDNNELKKYLCSKLLDKKAEIFWAYVIYTLGELDNIDSQCLQNLSIFLNQLNDYQIRSNTVLTITKQLDVIYEDSTQIELIIRELERNITLNKPLGWPESAYYKWYLVGASELSSQLEEHFISWKYYEKSSMEFSSIDWLSNYYLGVGFYEKAEYECEQGNIEVAIGNINMALELLNKTKDNQGFIEQSDKIGSGLRFKILLAEARKYMLSAYQYLEGNGLIHKENLYNASNLFKKAYDKYSFIDILGNESDSKKLSHSEKILITGLKTFVLFGLKLIELKKYSIELDENKIRLLFGHIQALTESIYDLGTDSKSKSFKKLSLDIHDSLKNIDKTNIITMQADTFIKNTMFLFSKPFPTPGTCPIYQFGHAELYINLPDAIFGKGTKKEPFVLYQNMKLIFDVSVSVIDRTKNDELVFICKTEANNNELSNNQKIPIHESLYRLRPIDYGIQSTSKVSIPYNFILEFKNQSCKQVVENRDVWVKIIDTKTIIDSKVLEKNLVNLKNQRKTLNDKIKKISSNKNNKSLQDGINIGKYKDELKNIDNEIHKIEGKL